MPEFPYTPNPPELTKNLRLRLLALRENEAQFPIRLSVDETEECIRILWEFVGHMGGDVGTQGYEARLIDRARQWAGRLQVSMLATIALVGVSLVDGDAGQMETALTDEHLRPNG